MLCLAIETSCDETGAAVVKDGDLIVSNIIASQIKSHAPYGGVVPELASRLHIENEIPIIRTALDEAGVEFPDIDIIGVTAGPGLIGSLLVGVETAKAMAYVLRKPLVPVHHIGAHLYSPFMRFSEEEKHEDFGYPYLGLVVSGGHSSLILARGPLEWEIVGQTLDDAAGEAYDKVAKLLQLGYPGGPVIDRLSKEGDPEYVRFPRPGSKSGNCHLSFSGLKTAVVRFVRENYNDPGEIPEKEMADICASFQAAVIDTLLSKTKAALKSTGVKRLAITGGVACNSALRSEARKRFKDITIHIPPPVLCTDNAAMIGGLAGVLYEAGVSASYTLNADAGYDLLKFSEPSRGKK